jgi:hypothetical protein
MRTSASISRIGWWLFVALRVAFIASVLVGAVFLRLGKDYGIFFVMLGLVFCSAAAMHKCAVCGKHSGWVGWWWLGFVNPFTTRCVNCDTPIRKPR